MSMWKSEESCVKAYSLYLFAVRSVRRLRLPSGAGRDVGLKCLLDKLYPGGAASFAIQARTAP